MKLEKKISDSIKKGKKETIKNVESVLNIESDLEDEKAVVTSGKHEISIFIGETRREEKLNYSKSKSKYFIQSKNTENEKIYFDLVKEF